MAQSRDAFLRTSRASAFLRQRRGAPSAHRLRPRRGASSPASSSRAQHLGAGRRRLVASVASATANLRPGRRRPEDAGADEHRRAGPWPRRTPAPVRRPLHAAPRIALCRARCQGDAPGCRIPASGAARRVALREARRHRGAHRRRRGAAEACRSVLRGTRTSPHRGRRGGRTKKKRAGRPSSCRIPRRPRRFTALLQVVLDRMRGHPEARDLFHLEPDVASIIVGEHAALRVRNARSLSRWASAMSSDAQGSGFAASLGLEVVQRFLSIGSPGGSCSARRRGPPSSSPRTRDTGSRSDQGSGPRCGALRVRRTGCGSTAERLRARIGQVDGASKPGPGACTLLVPGLVIAFSALACLMIPPM